MFQLNCGRFYAQYCTLFLTRYSPLVSFRKVLPTILSLFFSDKISKIGNYFLTLAPSLSLLFLMYPNLTSLNLFLGMKFEILPDRSMAYFSKELLDIILPFIAKLVNCSPSKCIVPGGFKKAIVSSLIRRSSLPLDELKKLPACL